MMNFITAPLIVWIVMSTLYGLIELAARQKERLAIIEKMGDKTDGSLPERKMEMLNLSIKSFSSLKIGCLLVGLGLGLLVGLWIHTALLSGNYQGIDGWRVRDMPEIAYGASVLLFGGLGLLVSFIIERKMEK